MEVDEIQKQDHQFPVEDGGGSGDVERLCGWPLSRIVRVSKASGGKDRHSKVLTSKGLRDRRVRLSVTTAIQFYDLQDRLGYDQPSKAVDWLIKAAANSIDELPSLDPTSFPDGYNHHHQKSTGNEIEFVDPNNSNNVSLSKSSACSSTSETSKGSGLSLSRSENRIRARERARIMATKKDKEVNGISQNSPFTDLLTGGISNNLNNTDYCFNRQPQFNITGAGDNINFTSSSFSGGGLGPGFNRGTLQSNLLSILPHYHHHLQRFQSASMVEGSTSTNFPFFIAPTGAPDHFPATGYDGGGDGGERHSDHHKEKSKNL